MASQRANYDDEFGHMVKDQGSHFGSITVPAGVKNESKDLRKASGMSMPGSRKGVRSLTLESGKAQLE